MNILETDLAIASALYTVLVGYVREAPERRLTYGALLNDAKARFPNSGPVQMAIPVSLGRRLDVVRMFLNEQKLPDLTSLVVNVGPGKSAHAPSIGCTTVPTRRNKCALISLENS